VCRRLLETNYQLTVGYTVVADVYYIWAAGVSSMPLSHHPRGGYIECYVCGPVLPDVRKKLKDAAAVLLQ